MIPFPNKKYDVIYADPPWSYKDKSCSGNAEDQYKTMSLDDICKLPVKDIAEKDCVLFFDAALLIEMKWNIYCQTVILADVDKDIQKQRVMARDNISAEDFEKIVSVQMDNEQKKKFADVIINTDKSENLLKVELINIIEELKNNA